MSTITLCTHRYIGLRNSCWAEISVFLMVIHDCTHCIQWGDSSPRLDLPQKSLLWYFVPRREQTRLFTACLCLATNVRTVKASHLAKFSSKVLPWLGCADVEKRCLLLYPAPPPHDCQYTTEQYILGENVEKCCSQGLGSTLTSKAAAFSLLAMCLVLANYPRRLQPALRQTRITSTTSYFNPTRPTYFLLASNPSFPRLFPFLLQFDLTRPSSQTFP